MKTTPNGSTDDDSHDWSDKHERGERLHGGMQNACYIRHPKSLPKDGLNPILFAIHALGLFPIYAWRTLVGGDIDEVVLWMKRIHPDPSIRARYLHDFHVWKQIVRQRRDQPSRG